MLYNGSDAPDRIDYFDSLARIRAIEREQEEKIIEEMKDWESKAAAFIGRHISAEQREQLLRCVPSIEDGFNRVQKSVFSVRLTPFGGDQKESSPQLPYWTLSNAINSRTDKLMKISEQLK
jgi:CRISPR/Cas system-associated endoribonuclease Cas2